MCPLNGGGVKKQVSYCETAVITRPETCLGTGRCRQALRPRGGLARLSRTVERSRYVEELGFYWVRSLRGTLSRHLTPSLPLAAAPSSHVQHSRLVPLARAIVRLYV